MLFTRPSLLWRSYGAEISARSATFSGLASWNTKHVSTFLLEKLWIYCSQGAMARLLQVNIVPSDSVYRSETSRSTDVEQFKYQFRVDINN